jgi:hypothetical protein
MCRIGRKKPGSRIDRGCPVKPARILVFRIDFSARKNQRASHECRLRMPANAKDFEALRTVANDHDRRRFTRRSSFSVGVEFQHGETRSSMRGARRQTAENRGDPERRRAWWAGISRLRRLLHVAVVDDLQLLA